MIGGSKRKSDFYWSGKLTLLGILMPALLVGQSLAQKITVEFDQGANFSSYKTYSFLKGS